VSHGRDYIFRRVVVQAGTTVEDGSNLKGSIAKALESLERAMAEHGDVPPDGTSGIPDGVATVTREQWRARYYADTRVKEAGIKDGTLRSRFNRAIEELVDKEQRIETVGDRYWISVASVA
jgi:hypothetical protein